MKQKTNLETLDRSSKRITGWCHPAWGMALMAFALLAAGCQTSPSPSDKSMFEMYDLINKSASVPDSTSVSNVNPTPASTAKSLILREGDVVKITFPSAPNLNSSQIIRRDGNITLQMVGELKAADLTPRELESAILKLYDSQLVTKEVTLTVESSTFPVFVTGAVVRPGKILSDRPLTALEAIMEAGGFDYTKANLKAVRIIRMESGAVKNHTVNLKLLLQGKSNVSFDLKPLDIVFVPEKFTWF